MLFLIFCPLDKRQQYLGLRGDCALKALWIHDRIAQNETDIDLAFLGSSHTMNGVDDSLIESNLGKQLKLVNLGYCRLGRNMHHSFLKELLAAKKLKYLVLEVREEEDYFSHLEFPYIASTKDVVTSVTFFNRKILQDLATHLSYKANRLVSQFFYEEEAVLPDLYGFSPLNQTAEAFHLAQKKESRSKPKKAQSTLIRDINLSFPRAYLDKIETICQENNVRLFYLYLPAYGTYLEQPKEFEFYKRGGELIIVPSDVLEDTSHWHDDQHLNQKGARALSLFLAKTLEAKILN